METSKMAVASYTPAFHLSEQQLLTIARLQAEANDVMGPGWRDSSIEQYPYYRASFIEAAEAMRAHGYKWWKHNTVLMDEIKMELIDILHFVVSDYIRNARPEAVAQELSSVHGEVTVRAIGTMRGKFYTGAAFERQPNSPHHSKALHADAFDFLHLCENFIVNTITEGRASMYMLYCLFERVGMTEAEVQGLYVGKNTLNQFRTANGLKDGTYMEIWNGVEDSTHLFNHIRDSASLKGSDPFTKEEIMSFLAERYATSDLQKKTSQ